MKRFIKCLITIGLIIIIISSVESVESNAARSPKMSKTKITLYVGKSMALKVKNLGKKIKVTWKSSNKSVATVSYKGKVKAKKKGTAIITAKFSYKKNGKKLTKTLKCKVTVKNKKTKPTQKTDNVTLEEWKTIYLEYFKNNPMYVYYYVFEDLNNDGIPEICINVTLEGNSFANAFIYINKYNEVKISKFGWICRNKNYIASFDRGVIGVDEIYKYNPINGEYGVVFCGSRNEDLSIYKINDKVVTEEQYHSTLNTYTGHEMWDISDVLIMKSAETLLEDIKLYK